LEEPAIDEKPIPFVFDDWVRMFGRPVELEFLRVFLAEFEGYFYRFVVLGYLDFLD